MSTDTLLHQHQAVKGSLGNSGISFFSQSDAAAPNGCFCVPKRPDVGSQLTFVNFGDILWCTGDESTEVELTYAAHKGSSVSIRTARVDLGGYGGSTDKMHQRVMKAAYANSQIQPRVLVLVNRHGGQGHAQRLLETQVEPVLRAARVPYTVVETQYRKHATDIAREMDIGKYDVVACCSGDGIPHEVANGMYQRADRAAAFSAVAVTQLPCGSGNAMSLSSHGTNHAGAAAVRMLKSARSRMDVMAVTQGRHTSVSFLSQSYGTIADCDIGTEHLRWMGPVRFDVGVAKSILAGAKFPCDIWVDYVTQDKAAIAEAASHRAARPAAGAVADAALAVAARLDEPVPAGWAKLAADVGDHLNIFYVGNMPYMSSDAQFFPAALPADGCMDMVVTTARSSRVELARLLLSVDSGSHFHSDAVHYAKVRAYRLVPRVAGKHYMSIDGESFPVEPLQVEVLPAVMTVLLQNGAFVETCFSEAA